MPHDAKAPAGPIIFEVENAGSSAVTELEVLDGETILGEVENLSEGLSGSFSLTLEKGEYTLRCNGGAEEDGTLTVTGKLPTAKTSPRGRSGDRPVPRIPGEEHRRAGRRDGAASSPRSKPATSRRRKPSTPPARIPYERIEPVAESFGDLDPRIDARENDVPAKRMERLPRDRESALGRRHDRRA